MRYWRRHSGLRALLAVLVLIAQAACTSWRTQQVTPEELLREGPLQSVRLTLHDSTRSELHSPILRNDSLVGLKQPAGTKGSVALPLQNARPDTAVATADTVAFALADVQSVAVRKRAPLKAIGLTVGILGGVMLGAAAACANDCYSIDLGGVDWNEY